MGVRGCKDRSLQGQQGPGMGKAFGLGLDPRAGLGNPFLLKSFCCPPPTSIESVSESPSMMAAESVCSGWQHN